MTAERPIRFGTSGWRGELGEEVTFPRLRVLVRAVARWILQERAGDRVLVGWDARFASGRMAVMAAALLAESGLRPQLSSRPTPTPVIGHALRRRRAAAALVLTASHNPPSDHGLKVFGSWGGAITDAHARRIEALAAAAMDEHEAPRAVAPPRRYDFATPYRNALAGWLDGAALAGSGLVVHYDAMHGVGGGVLDAVLRGAGARVEGLRLEPDPRFGGVSPDPVPARLGELARRVRRQRGPTLGLANDGDADRIGVVDGRGRFLSETRVMALLVDHLAETGRIRRGVAISAGTGSLVEKVAARHGLSVERHPVGFKHLSAAMAAGRVDVAGEESGGFAHAGLSRDKDGILAGLLLANLVATTGEPLEARLARLEGELGASACGRATLAATSRVEAALERLVEAPPERVGRARVVAVDHDCGLRLGLKDGGFLILRRSGTERVLRIYAEASSEEALMKRLAQGERLLRRA